jgi:hypothetical protein
MMERGERMMERGERMTKEGSGNDEKIGEMVGAFVPAYEGRGGWWKRRFPHKGESKGIKE